MKKTFVFVLEYERECSCLKTPEEDTGFLGAGVTKEMEFEVAESQPPRLVSAGNQSQVL